MAPKSNIFLQICLAIILGALVPFAFSPYNYWFITPVILALFINLIYKNSSLRAFGLGVIFGFSFFGFGISWIHISLHEFGGGSLTLSFFLALSLAFYLALYYGVLAGLLTRISWPFTLKYGFLLPFLGTILEVMRAYFMTGFPWLALGYTLLDSPFSFYLYPTMGALISSFWVYFTAGFLFLFWRGLADRERSFITLLKVPFLYGIFMMGMVYVLFTWGGDSIEAASEPIEAALIQGNIHQGDKFSESSYQETLDTYLSLTREAAAKVELIILPETAFPNFFNQLPLVAKELQSIAREEHVNIVTGVFNQIEVNGQQEVLNSMVYFSPKTDEVTFYNKYKLVPFGEYIPLRSVLHYFNRWIDIPYGDIISGEKEQPPFQFTFLNEGPLPIQGSGSICYEAVFSHYMRYQAKEGHFLINISNDAWFGASIGPWQHLQMARSRALEYARPMLRSTNTGLTAFINHQGELEALAPSFSQAILIHHFTPMKGLTAYVKWGDEIWYFILFLSLILMAILSPNLYLSESFDRLDKPKRHYAKKEYERL